jgi:fructose-1,6-bisphosphatase/inositol monophosphatase family enzyme
MTEPPHRAVPSPSTRLAESDANKLLLLAGGAVDSAARLLIQGRSHLGGLIAKGDRDYASRVDFQIEDSVRDTLARAARDIPFLGEERGGHPHAPLLWVLDPIDGTTNFIKGSEAGGLTYDWDGSEHSVDSRFTIASAPSLKPSLLELLPAT